jgi:sugar/nucleoside kinase (ribokinase family)
VDTSGAGNGAEGAVVVYLLDMNDKRDKKAETAQRLINLGNIANAMGAVAITSIGAALKTEQLALIKERYLEISGIGPFRPHKSGYNNPEVSGDQRPKI